MPRKTLTQKLEEANGNIIRLKGVITNLKGQTINESRLRVINKDLTTSLQIQKEAIEGLRKVNLKLDNTITKLTDKLETIKSTKPDSEYFTGRTTYTEAGGTKPLSVRIPRSYPNEEELRRALEIQKNNIIGGAGKILSQTIHRKAHYETEI